MKIFLSYIYAFFLSLNPGIAACVAAMASIVAAFTWLNQQWLLLIAKLDTLIQASFAGTISFEPIALVNTLMPLQELLSYLAAWFVILTVCSVIRIIKSFIPAIAT